MVTFSIIAAVGFILLVFTALLDEIFSFGDGLFSGVTIGAGSLIFGASGIIASATGLPSYLAYVIAAVLGVATLFMSRAMTKFAKNGETQPRPSLVGVEGVVTIATSPNGGEVRLESIHEMEARMAWSEKKIPSGKRIVVVSESGSLKVETLTPTQNEA